MVKEMVTGQNKQQHVACVICQWKKVHMTYLFFIENIMQMIPPPPNSNTQLICNPGLEWLSVGVFCSLVYDAVVKECQLTDPASTHWPLPVTYIVSNLHKRTFLMSLVLKSVSTLMTTIYSRLNISLIS